MGDRLSVRGGITRFESFEYSRGGGVQATAPAEWDGVQHRLLHEIVSEPVADATLAHVHDERGDARLSEVVDRVVGVAFADSRDDLEPEGAADHRCGFECGPRP